LASFTRHYLQLSEITGLLAGGGAAWGCHTGALFHLRVIMCYKVWRSVTRGYSVTARVLGPGTPWRVDTGRDARTTRRRGRLRYEHARDPF